MTRETLPTHTLVDRAISGDKTAVDVLCRRLQPRLKAWAQGRLPSHARGLADTDDLIQEALVRSVSRLDVFQPQSEGSFLRYVQRSVKNLILNEIRRPASRRQISEVAENQVDTAATPLDQFVDRQSLERYEKALDRLPADQQELVVARLELDMSFQEIALHTGRPSADAARMAVKRAVRNLAKEMDHDQAQRSR